MGILQGESRITVRVYRINADGEREEVRSREELVGYAPSSWTREGWPPCECRLCAGRARNEPLAGRVEFDGWGVRIGEFVHTYRPDGRRIGSGYVVARHRVVETGVPVVTVRPRFGELVTVAVSCVRPAEAPED